MASYSEVVGALEALVRVVRKHDADSPITKGVTFANALAIISEARRGISAPLAWTPLRQAAIRPDDLARMGASAIFGDTPEVWTNSRYQVMKATLPNGTIYLSIKRLDQAAIRSWRDLQRIKNELVHPECEAVEIFPAESRKLDGANQFHLWINPDPDARLAVGDHGRREVLAPQPEDLHGQEPFEAHDPFGPERAP